MCTLWHFSLQGKVPPLAIMTSNLEQGWMKQSACLAILGSIKLWVLPESMSIIRGIFWRTLWPAWFVGWWLRLRHEEIYLVGPLEQEVVECHCHHLWDPKHHKNNAYFWWTPLPEKQEIPEKMWWWHHYHVFSGISCFWGSEARQKYAEWVFVGCVI